jgi:hypothetical protein
MTTLVNGAATSCAAATLAKRKTAMTALVILK